MPSIGWLAWRTALHIVIALVVVKAGTVGYQRWNRSRETPSRGRLSGLIAVAGAASGEGALVLGLYALWQYVNQFAHARTVGAFPNAQTVVDVERAMHLPSELSVQQEVIGHPALVSALNIYYERVHLTSMVLLIVWLYVRHRDKYPFLRNMIVLTTGFTLVIQFIPVAPPRFFPGMGFVDTADLYGESLYRMLGIQEGGQLAAMPSLHVGWAILVAIAVIVVLDSPWRWLIVLHPVITTWVVVATANHWWLDGLAEVVIIAVAAVILVGLRRAYTRRVSQPETLADPLPEPDTTAPQLVV